MQGTDETGTFQFKSSLSNQPCRKYDISLTYANKRPSKKVSQVQRNFNFKCVTTWHTGTKEVLRINAYVPYAQKARLPAAKGSILFTKYSHRIRHWKSRDLMTVRLPFLYRRLNCFTRIDKQIILPATMQERQKEASYPRAHFLPSSENVKK